MCGRYALYGPVSRLREAFNAELEGFDFQPRYNAAPMQRLPVVRQRPTGERVIQLLRWGLLPSWAKDQTIASKLINARGETLAEKPSFRTAYRKRRCIVPANGFMEWKALEKGKQPYYIHAANDDLFGLAGLWERWSPADGEAIDTFTIVTTNANGALRDLHDRMPVILAPENYGRWLDQQTRLEDLQLLVTLCPDAMISMYLVSLAVGNVKNDEPGLIEPVELM